MAWEEILLSKGNEVTSLYQYPRNLAVAMLGVKVAPIDLGKALLQQQAVLEAVAVMLLEMAVVGALFFCICQEIVERSSAAWLVGIESDIYLVLN